MAHRRGAIETAGAQIAFVHMSPPDEADHWFRRYGVDNIVRVSDPERSLYQAFALEQAPLADLIHPRVWWPWLKTAVVSGYGFGPAGPNWRQLTGVFVVHRGHVLSANRHRNSAGRPDLVALVHGLKLGSAGVRS